MKKHLMVFFLFCFFSITSLASIPYFKTIQIDQENNNVHVNVLFQDHEGFVWTGTDRGVYRFDGFLFNHIHIGTKDSNENVTCLAEDINKSLLVGLSSGGIMKYEKGYFTNIKSPFTSPVKSLIQTADGVLWVATYGEGIFYLNQLGWHRIAGLPDPFIYNVVQHPNGVLLAGTDQGLVVIDPRDKQLHYKVYNTKDGLPDNLVREIYCDKNGDVWLGMQEKGICKFNLSSGEFTIPDNLKSWNFGSITCFSKLEDEFWIGTSDDGIIDFEFSEDKRVRTFSKSNGFGYTNINDILRSNDGNIWIATENKLLFTPGEKYEVFHGDKNIVFDSIHAIATDQTGYLWLCNNQGLMTIKY